MNRPFWFAQDSGQSVPPSQPWRTGDALLNIRGDFGSVRDAQGRSMFSPFLLTLMDDAPAEAEDWFARWKARGYTHAIFTPRYSYSGSPIEGRSYSPGQFGECIRAVLNRGISPVIMLSDTPDEPIRERAQALKDAGHAPYVIVVPGWEIIPTREWTSKQASDVLLMLHELGFPYIGVHLQPGRWSMSSNPIEADDPWQGNEQACWKSHGGQYVSVFLAQTEHEGWDTVPMTFEDRWRDGVPRMCRGMNGWRIMPMCLAESVLYNDYRNEFGPNGELVARQVASRARAIAAEYGATVGYLNGAPL